MKKLLLIVTMTILMVGTASAGGGKVHKFTWERATPLAIVGTGLVFLMLSDKGQACDDLPVKTAHWTGNPGYNFTVAGCDQLALGSKITYVN